MEDPKFKNLAAVALERRWKNLADKGDWDSILQLTTERLNHLYEDFKENQHELLDSIKEGKKGLKQEEALTRLYVANTICACHSLLRLIQTLDNDIYKDLIEINADERIKRLEERIKKLEAK
tara:strand:- start:668 stop:1033 length:366 start_codon:yes stop_codon:yes gene_type:complete